MDANTLQKHFNIIRIIWLAMLASLGIYLVVSHAAGDAIRQQAASDVPLDLMRRILIGISAVELIFIDIFRKRALTPRAGLTPAAAIQKYSVTSLVSLAVAESIGIYGMVLYFLGDSAVYLYFLIAIAAMAMLYYRPKFGALEALVRAAARGL
jgi:F0F1-type ATP synthase membrane subunit c/vacuolar-type H+-ATPase subunit K